MGPLDNKYFPEGLTCGVGAAPTLRQTQGTASPCGGRFVIGEARRWTGGGIVGAPGALPQLMGERRLAVRNGSWRPRGLHLRQFS